MAKEKKYFLSLLGPALLAALLYPGIAGIARMERPPFPGWKAAAEGEYTGTARSRFEESVPMREGAILFWSAIKYRLFREGRPGVLIGRDNRLYTTEEFDEEMGGKNSPEAFFDRVGEAGRFFAGEGLSLAVVLVPSKSRIQRDITERYPYPENIDGRYGYALEQLSSRGIPAIDLRAPLEDIVAESDPYYRYDTHWTFSGARAAAAAVADWLAPAIDAGGLEKRGYYIKGREEKTFTGDLLDYVPALKSSLEKRGGAEGYFELDMEDANPPALGLFDDPVIPVILVGTSYSADRKWNFGNALRLALQLDVLNMAEEGKGPLVPMEKLIESGYFRETGSSIILWEIPERYIPVAP